MSICEANQGGARKAMVREEPVHPELLLLHVRHELQDGSSRRDEGHTVTINCDVRAISVDLDEHGVCSGRPIGYLE
jgi:hypothetical protein